MPLSKVKQAEYQRQRRKRLKGDVIPSVIPKLGYYQLVSHFGQVKDHRHADQFFRDLFDRYDAKLKTKALNRAKAESSS